jgi:hypothetical protein
MGGPQGTIGWTAFALFLIAPLAIWWTKGTVAGSFCQHLFLALTASALGYFAYVAIASS